MNRSGLKSASRQSLADAHTSPRKLTLLFLLCLYLVTIPLNLGSFFMNQSMSRLSGLGTIGTRNRYYLWSFLISLAITLLSQLWNAGYTAFTIRFSRRERAGFDDFFTGFRTAGRVLILLLLMFLYIWLWSLLFLIPGLVAAYRYRFALFALLDNPELTASQAIDCSKRLTYGHKAELFILDLSFIWYYLLLGIGTAISTAYAYELYPIAHTAVNYLVTYGLNVAICCTVMALFEPYVQTTYAHTYNWLLSLDKSRSQGTYN